MWGSVWGGVVISLMISAPGWALLTINHAWRRWPPLQRWCVAVGLSIAFYPTLFYLARPLWPILILGYWKLLGVTLACLVWAVWRLGPYWREQFQFEEREWAALGLVVLTLFTRFWIIRDQPYPAWSDSLHHTLLTQLTAVQGRLPLTLEPYAPIPLGQYHLGLYALSGTVEILTHLPSHTALLWVAQTLNGLCGLGVFLMLDRRSGRWGAVVGVAVAGLFSFQPNWYVNWGRFTQVASQTLLLIAAMVTWEAMTTWRQATSRREVLGLTALAALLSSGVFLLHFRVAAFFLPLLLWVGLWELWRAYRQRETRWFLAYGVIAIVLALLLIWPVLWDAVQIFWMRATAAPTSPPQSLEVYYGFNWASVLALSTSPWLLGFAGGALVLGIIRRQHLTALMGLWGLGLCLLGQAYVVNVPWLRVTNWGAVLIVAYLPIAIVIGVGAQVLGEQFPAFARTGLASTLLLAALFSHGRTQDVEAYRYFVTPADVEAMAWINAHTPTDAVFAVNTYFWLPRAPHGTDAGYWIPYFTGRHTTVGLMLNSLGSKEYNDQIVSLSQTVEAVDVDATAFASLRAAGVAYVYVGARGDFDGGGLDATRLAQNPALHLVYQQDGVSIFEYWPAYKVEDTSSIVSLTE